MWSDLCAAHPQLNSLTRSPLRRVMLVERVCSEAQKKGHVQDGGHTSYPLWELWVRSTPNQPTSLAARTIAMMPVLSASGSVGHDSITAAKSGAIRPSCARSAPHFAPLGIALVEFLADSCAGSNPVPAISKNIAEISV